jgi:hypothetical protein
MTLEDALTEIEAQRQAVENMMTAAAHARPALSTTQIATNPGFNSQQVK